MRLLARREHSRAELARKLAAHADSTGQVDALLDELCATRLLSNQRFAEALVHRRAERFGVAAIRHELRTHELDHDLVQAHVAALERTEFERARAVWRRRFGTPPDSAADHVRQARFLLARGFCAETVRTVLGAAGDGTG